MQVLLLRLHFRGQRKEIDERLYETGRPIRSYSMIYGAYKAKKSYDQLKFFLLRHRDWELVLIEAEARTFMAEWMKSEHILKQISQVAWDCDDLL